MCRIPPRRGPRAIGGLVAVVAFVVAAAPASAQTQWASLVGRPYQHLIERVAIRYQLDPHLFAALIEVESARRADAVSIKGARGLGQLMPETARRFGVQDVHDPEDNLDGSAQYLAWLITRYRGDLTLALAAYNAGEGAVDKYGDIPPYPETQGYVERVLARAGLRRSSRAVRADLGTSIRVNQDASGRITLTNVP